MSTSTLITAEEYLLHADSGRPTELVEGIIRAMNPPGFRHGQICNTIGRLLGNFVDEHECGRVVSNDSGVITRRDPDTVRGADVAYYSYETVPRDHTPEGYPPGPPDIVFEVLSPSDQRSGIDQKVDEYLQAGVAVVCVVDDRGKVVTIHRCEQDAQVLGEAEEMTLPGVLPGFVVAVSKLFA